MSKLIHIIELAVAETIFTCVAIPIVLSQFAMHSHEQMNLQNHWHPFGEYWT
jgi:hypothetical protein